jgi:hypothetical protein
MQASDVSAQRRGEAFNRLARRIGIAVLLLLLMPQAGFTQEPVRPEDRLVVRRIGILKPMASRPDVHAVELHIPRKYFAYSSQATGDTPEVPVTHLQLNFAPILNSVSSVAPLGLSAVPGRIGQREGKSIRVNIHALSPAAKSEPSEFALAARLSANPPKLRLWDGVRPAGADASQEFYVNRKGVIAATRYRTSDGRNVFIYCEFENLCSGKTMWYANVSIEYVFYKSEYWQNARSLDLVVMEFLSSLKPSLVAR